MRIRATICVAISAVVVIMCTSTAFAAEKVEPIFTISSDMSDVAAELLTDGDAYIDAYGSGKSEKEKVLMLVQSYVDSVTFSSQTPSVKGAVIRSGQSDEQIKLVLLNATDGYTDEELAALSAKAGNTIESINNFLTSQLSYDDSNTPISMSSSSATAKGALSTGKAVCMGYANAFSVLAEQVGIKSVKVRGYIGEAYHVLNVAEGGFAVDVTGNDDQDNRYLLISFEDYCNATGFKPEININTAFELKYGFLNKNNL